MFSTNQFANKFGTSRIKSCFFNQYNAITQTIDRLLSNIDLFDVVEEYSSENYIVYRCDIDYLASCDNINLIYVIVKDYQEQGWLVSYNENTKTIHFQTFVKVNTKTEEFSEEKGLR